MTNDADTRRHLANLRLSTSRSISRIWSTNAADYFEALASELATAKAQRDEARSRESVGRSIADRTIAGLEQRAEAAESRLAELCEALDTLSDEWNEEADQPAYREMANAPLMRTMAKQVKAALIRARGVEAWIRAHDGFPRRKVVWPGERLPHEPEESEDE